MMFDFCAVRSYNTSPVIRMNEKIEEKYEGTKAEAEVISNEALVGQISLIDLLAEMRC